MNPEAEHWFAAIGVLVSAATSVYAFGWVVFNVRILFRVRIQYWNRERGWISIPSDGIGTALSPVSATQQKENS